MNKLNEVLISVLLMTLMLLPVIVSANFKVWDYMLQYLTFIVVMAIITLAIYNVIGD